MGATVFNLKIEFKKTTIGFSPCRMCESTAGGVNFQIQVLERLLEAVTLHPLVQIKSIILRLSFQFLVKILIIAHAALLLQTKVAAIIFYTNKNIVNLVGTLYAFYTIFPLNMKKKVEVMVEPDSCRTITQVSNNPKQVVMF